MTENVFCALLKFWRCKRGFTQLDLALEAGISPRHLCFLENGRSMPSEQMVHRLSRSLDLSLRDTDQMLISANFNGHYSNSNLNEIGDVFEAAIIRMMRQQEPFPLSIMNANYDIIRANEATLKVFGSILEKKIILDAPINLYDFVFNPNLGKEGIKNWHQIGQFMISNLYLETLRNPHNMELKKLLIRVLEYPEVPKSWCKPDFSKSNDPNILLELGRNEVEFRFFTTRTFFSAPNSVAMQELQIESYFPADEMTATKCVKLLN